MSKDISSLEIAVHCRKLLRLPKMSTLTQSQAGCMSLGLKWIISKLQNYFDIKIKDVLRQTSIDDNICNGVMKVMVENKFFMDQTSVRQCIYSLKVKNTDGYDLIPQRILVGSIGILIGPFSILFEKIYYQRTIPGQWLISKDYTSI
jgi:hypothetical protein